MRISPGTRLGSYEITAQIGEGGMGEVYRATDNKLRREVAIKVLPESFSEDPERLARFEREAQLLAQLHHPNIASIFGLEESDGVRALVMELVEGPTLDERLEQGGLPLEEILLIAQQIAEALEEAHEKGIIHRDLKPQNIKVTSEGKVKVLDFGLAKAMDKVAAASNVASASQLAASPTLTLGATMQGAILGTAAYMSPEQAAGGLADRRSDCWSFGVVLYEMLSGQRLFDGESVSHVLAGVLKDEPDFDALPDDLPPRIKRLIQRCLRKKPRERLQAIGDARLVIDEVLSGAAEEVAAVPLESTAGPTQPLWPLRSAVAALALTTLVLGTLLVLDRPRPPKVVRSYILPPPDTSFFLGGSRPGPIALSPDGSQIAFTCATSDSRLSLWVRAVDTLDARELPGTDNARYPFWSPDSKQIAYFDGSHLNKIALTGAPPVELALAQNGKGGSWSPGGVIVFAPDQASPLYAISASGGKATPLTALDEALGDSSHRHPRFMPDGEHFLFIARTAGDAELRIGTLDGSKAETIFPIEGNAEYAAGHLLFLRESILMAQPFDATSSRLEGEAVPIAESVLRIPEAFLSVFTVSTEGTLAYQTGSDSNLRKFVWRDREGQELGSLGEPINQRHARISPDGRYVATVIATEVTDIWIYDVERGLRSRFTFDPAPDSNPLWSPDGQELAFTSTRKGGPTAIWIAEIGGSEPPRLVAADRRNLKPESWSPDGEHIVASTLGGGSRSDIVLVLAEGGEVSPLIATDFDESPAQISPDGRWLVYDSNESGRYEVYVTRFPKVGRKWQISLSEGQKPAWNRNGREIFYRDSRGLYAAEVDGRGEEFEVGEVSYLFDLPLRFSISRQYDVAPDGQSFLINEPVGQTDASPVTLVQNWVADLPKP